MSHDSPEHLLAALQRSALLGPEELAEARRELAPLCGDAPDLAARLVEVGWLTAYQAQHLLAGEWGELVLGPHQILDKLGEGGVCRVCMAWDTSAGQLVAVKILHTPLAVGNDAGASFRAEAATLAGLAHPNIIKSLGGGEDDGRHYYAMELVEGMDLEKFVQLVGPLPVAHACDYMRQAAQGLQAAHQAGLVHRDIKPANLFLANPPLPPAAAGPRRTPPEPAVKVIDWGLARSPRDAREAHGGANGQLLGTADYMAPEQIKDSSLVDIRADIYSLGCTLYFLLAGHPPFPGTSVMQKILQHQEAPPPSLKHARPDVPDELDGLVQRMLAKRPEDRPQIPLLLVTPLRKIAHACAGKPAAVATGDTPGPARPTLFNLSRPSTQTSIARPTTGLGLPRPGP